MKVYEVVVKKDKKGLYIIFPKPIRKAIEKGEVTTLTFIKGDLEIKTKLTYEGNTK